MKEQTFTLSAAKSSANERAAFIRRTYSHLAVAILAFVGIEYYLVHSPFAAQLASSMTSGFSWMIVLGLFMGVGYFADKLARSENSEQMQYLGLGLFVIAEAIVFLPLLFMATMYGGEWFDSYCWINDFVACTRNYCDRFHYPKRFFLHEGNPFNRKFCRSWFYYLQYDLWLFAWIGFCLSHGFICCRFGSLYHF